MLTRLLYTVYLNFCITSTLIDGSDLQNNEIKLRHIHILFRHGDRSPTTSWPLSNKTFQELWPAGRGQLTDTGIEQEFNLGRWVRTKYPTVVRKKYNGSEYHMRSTDIDRTLMSAQSFTAGFYEHTESPLQKFNISWIPIPVHTVRQSNDVLLSAAECPRLSLLQQLQMDSEESKAFEQKHQSLLELLNKQFPGVSVDRNNVGQIHDAILCMQANKMELPVWFTPSVKTELDEIQRYYWVKRLTSTPEIVRFEIGYFLYTMMEHFDALVKGKISTTFDEHGLSIQHLMAYSAHDTDVTYLLAAFDVYDQQPIPYSSAVVFELHGPEPPAPANKFRFRLRYKRGWTDNDGVYLQPPFCKEFAVEDGCPLDTLRLGISPMLLTHEQFCKQCPTSRYFESSFCQNPEVHPNTMVYVLIVLVVAISMLCVLSLVLLYSVRRRQRAIPFARFQPTI